LTLIASDAEGMNVGMPVTYAGFSIGTVTRMELTDSGDVRIDIKVREKDARWLRTTSVFTLDKPFWGAAKIRAASPNPADPPLPDKSERKLTSKDTAGDVPQLIAKANSILDNVNSLTRPESNLSLAIAQLNTMTARMNGEYGVIGGVTGSPERAKKLLATVDKLNALVATLDGISRHAATVLVKTDQRVFGKGGVMDEAQRSMLQLNQILVDARDSLKKADSVLANAQTTTANANALSSHLKDSTTELVTLRAEVDDSVRKFNQLINEINRKWPLARDRQIKLP